MFEKRRDWIVHEREEHRLNLRCPFCSKHLVGRSKFQEHLKEFHRDKEIALELDFLSADAMKTPWNGFTASDCHFCDEWSIGLARQLRHVHEPSTHSSSEALIVTERQFYKHVGRHMEQLSLFALPKQYLENHNTLSESSSTSNTGENSEVLGSQHKIIDFAAPKEQIEQPIDIRRFIERTKREEAERPDKLEGEIELLKQNAVEAAAIQAREDVERAAAEKLKKTKEEHEKVLKKHIEAEEEAKKKKKEAEEMVMKLRPADEDAQPPIEFKDALGRKFFFPWKYCKTWKVMTFEDWQTHNKLI